MTGRLCAVSVDLDEIPHYYAIHGLAQPAGDAACAVYRLGVPRLRDLLRAYAAPATWFVVGADASIADNGALLQQLGEAGDELGNHSLDHCYDLTRLGRADLQRQVRAGADAVEAATGRRPIGFRAPGYTVTDELFDALADCDVAYDSSVFPCPIYYAAKLLAIARHRVRGRRSHAIVDQPAVLRAPTEPYRVGRPYWRRGRGMLELPIQVTRRLRLPFIGTVLTLAGPKRARWLARQVARGGFVNLELHGLDALDGSDGLEALQPHQPDLRVKLERKLAALGAVLEALREAGYAFVRLDEAAEALDPAPAGHGAQGA